MDDGYRIAECTDYGTLVALLEQGNPKSVLMQSVSNPEIEPQPLLDFFQGPFEASSKGISCSFMGGQFYLYITPNALHNVSVRPKEGDWRPPSSGEVVLLIQE